MDMRQTFVHTIQGLYAQSQPIKSLQLIDGYEKTQISLSNWAIIGLFCRVLQFLWSLKARHQLLLCGCGGEDPDSNSA
jgi:hypothetical protein